VLDFITMQHLCIAQCSSWLNRWSYGGFPRLILHFFWCLQNKGASLLNLVPVWNYLTFLLFHHGTSTIESVLNLIQPVQVYHTGCAVLSTTH